MYSVFNLSLVCFVSYFAVYVNKARECHRYIIDINIVLSNNLCSKNMWSYNFLDAFVSDLFKIFRYECLMNNEFVKVLKVPKAVLLHAAMQLMQQRCTFEILRIPKQSCTVSGLAYVNDMQGKQLSVYRTNSIIWWVLCTENTCF